VVEVLAEPPTRTEEEFGKLSPARLELYKEQSEATKGIARFCVRLKGQIKLLSAQPKYSLLGFGWGLGFASTSGSMCLVQFVRFLNWLPRGRLPNQSEGLAEFSLKGRKWGAYCFVTFGFGLRG